jgi:lipopolysaccharide biosynthesis glycosyltransferase
MFENKEEIIPHFTTSSVPIVISFDNNYCISGAALLTSIIKHASPSKNYDIVIMEDKITDENKSRLLSLSKSYKNISIRFFSIHKLAQIKDGFLRSYFSPIIYGRLFIPQLFKGYNKVIYIDSDMIVCHDPADLLNIDLGDNLIAAVKDLVMEGYVKFKIPSAVESGSLEASEYLKSKLNMTEPKKYFQAGLLIFNNSQILKENKDLDLIKEIGPSPFWFLDQDILNKEN